MEKEFPQAQLRHNSIGTASFVKFLTKEVINFGCLLDTQDLMEVRGEEVVVVSH